ncbi:MAG: ABC transporter ATP-binding protein/permease [Candidatus Pacebacteria bacterium]|nr:ABC transporter ATP-binding protein/permease [Candidatus Paceibacterota bacterium]
MLKLLKQLQAILPPKDKFKVIGLIVFMIIAGLLEVISIGLLSGFVAGVADPDLILNNQYVVNVLSFLNITTDRQILVYGTITLILVFLLKNLYLIGYKYIQARFIYNRYRSISSRLFKLYMSAPYSFYLNRNTAGLVRNVSTESRFIAVHVMLPILQITTELVMAIAIIILLLSVQSLVTIFTLISLGAISFAFLRLTKKTMKKHGQKALQERERIIKTVNEGIGGFKEVTLSNRQPWFVKKFNHSMLNLSKAEIFQQTTKQSVSPIIETIAIAGILLIAFILLKQGYSLAALSSILALFALSIRRLLPAINNMVVQYNTLRYHSYSVKPIYEDLMNLEKYQKDNKTENTKNTTEDKDTFFKDKIEISSLNFKYQKDQDLILQNISLSIKQGQAIALVGSTGSGKTTLVDLILGLLKPSSGKIEVDGKDIYTHLSKWQKNIGYIPQFIYLADDSIKNNIALGLEENEIDNQKIKKAIKVAQLTEFINKLPEKENTKIGERGIRLSGGQRQRIGIARALYDNPEILVMDEATSSLDNITEKFIIDAIEKLKENRTIIIIAHRLSTVKNCDRLYILKEGKIVDQGSYEELITKNQEFKEMSGE